MESLEPGTRPIWAPGPHLKEEGMNMISKLQHRVLSLF